MFICIRICNKLWYNRAYISFLNIFVCNHFLVTIILFVYFLINEIYVLIIDVYFTIMRKKERTRQKEGDEEKEKKGRRRDERKA